MNNSLLKNERRDEETFYTAEAYGILSNQPLTSSLESKLTWDCFGSVSLPDFLAIPPPRRTTEH